MIDALLGQWRLEVTMLTRAEVPVLGSFLTRTRSVLEASITREGDALVQTQRVCTTVVNDGRGLVKTVMPPSFLAALPTARFPIVLEPHGDTWHYSADFGRQVLGWTGEGALPTVEDLSSAVDGDHDGQPGLTVLVHAPIVGTGEVYVAQVGRSFAEGLLKDGAIAGDIRVLEFGQSVVGASSRMLQQGPTLTPAGGSFTMVRGSCASGT